MPEIVCSPKGGATARKSVATENGVRPPEGIDRLTPRQQEILKLLAKGFYYKEIGAALGISHSTVRAHLHTVYQKLEVRSRSRAVIKFREHAWVIKANG